MMFNRFQTKHLAVSVLLLGLLCSTSWANTQNETPAKTLEAGLEFVVLPALKPLVSESTSKAAESATIAANQEQAIEPSEGWSYLMWETPRHSETIEAGTTPASLESDLSLNQKPLKRVKSNKYRFRSVRRQTMPGLI